MWCMTSVQQCIEGGKHGALGVLVVELVMLTTRDGSASSKPKIAKFYRTRFRVKDEQLQKTRHSNGGYCVRRRWGNRTHLRMYESKRKERYFRRVLPESWVQTILSVYGYNAVSNTDVDNNENEVSICLLNNRKRVEPSC